MDFLEKRGKLPEDKKKIFSYRYLETGHIDSFGMIQLIMSLEDEFGIELQPEHLENLEGLSTVGGLVDLVETRVKAKR